MLTPWPAVDSELLQPYAGRYKTEAGSEVVITIQDGRLLVLPDDSPGVFLMPSGEDTLARTMMEQARVVFEGGRPPTRCPDAILKEHKAYG